MAGKKKKTSTGSATIALNKRARHEYFIEQTFEAGLVLEGWEVKSLRDGKVNLSESYVLIKDGEAFLFGCHISPLQTASTHINPDPLRSRKLLLHRRELGQLFGAVAKQGLTCVPLALYWKSGRVKCEIALAKGKKLHDKRATEKERDWNREKQRVLRHQ
ncbi:MAG: SsrA-binding protein SmpB [Pseudomonadales bacterium]|nr:SsrA-binding protein SmpB [Pseudomonadales bacterium]